jgi:hypothetical protein
VCNVVRPFQWALPALETLSRVVAVIVKMILSLEQKRGRQASR